MQIDWCKQLTNWKVHTTYTCCIWCIRLVSISTFAVLSTTHIGLWQWTMAVLSVPAIRSKLCVNSNRNETQKKLIAQYYIAILSICRYFLELFLFFSFHIVDEWALSAFFCFISWWIQWTMREYVIRKVNKLAWVNKERNRNDNKIEGEGERGRNKKLVCSFGFDTSLVHKRSA